jgi:hypothetical protein
MEKTFEQGHFRNQASTWRLSRALISIMLPPLGFTHPHFNIALTFGLYPTHKELFKNLVFVLESASPP